MSQFATRLVEKEIKLIDVEDIGRHMLILIASKK